MCVRYFIRRRCCQSWKKTSKTKMRHSDCHKGFCRSASIEPRPHTLRPEAVDLFCPEFLPMSDPQKCHAAAADAAGEAYDLPTYDLLLSPMTIKTTAAALDDSSAFCAVTRFAKPPSDHLKSGPWDDIDNKSQILSFGPCAADKSEARRIADGVVWNNFCPDPGSESEVGAGKEIARQSEKAEETCISLGNSRQSNFLPCDRWPIQPHGPFASQDRERAFNLSPDPPTTPTESYSAPQTSLLTSFNLINGESIQEDPGEYDCTSRFCEAIGILVERETETCYQLSELYIQKLTENSEQKFDHNELRAARRRIVKWIFEVVRLLHLNSLAAAHAVSILDRYLSQSLFPGPKNEANPDIRLAATACIWIAAKLEDSDAPHLASIRGISYFQYDEEKIREMEVSVLKCLGWRMLAATACDFLTHMVAQLPAFGLPSHLLRPVGHRSEEIIQGTLSGIREGLPPYTSGSGGGPGPHMLAAVS